MAKKKTTKPQKKSPEMRPGGCSAELLLDPVFYPRRTIQRAAKDWASLARIEATPQGDRLRLRFSGMRRGTCARLPDEFVNYLLSLVVEES